jgi:hypothetical protein
MILVQLSNGVSILWENQSRVYVVVPATLYGKTQVKCYLYKVISYQRSIFIVPHWRNSVYNDEFGIH